MYSIVYSKQALKTLSRIPKNTAELIRNKIVEHAHDPYRPNSNAKPLEGQEGYRLRVGDWRVIYEIQNRNVMIYIVKIGARGDVYQ